MSDRFMFEGLESRRLMAWSSYASLVNQDEAAALYPKITGQGQTVAVIDTGINYKLSVLGGGFGAGKKVVGGYDFYANDADPMDTTGHGTAVASVIAAESYTVGGVTYQGVAPDASLVALRVGTEDDISNENIEDALQWVIDHHDDYNITVVNLSIGSGAYADAETDQFSDEFQALADLGIFVAAASGNSNDQQSGPISRDGVASPAADPNVFAVGAIDAGDVITTWAQRGDELDLLAPGVDIVLPQLNGTYAAEDGTSFASPMVAGVAALIKQADPSASGGDIGSLLMTSGVSNRDGDNETGNTTGLLFSRLDITAALRLVGQRLGRTETLALGKSFDTALDAKGVLHAAFYDTTQGRLLYATRDTTGLWSRSYVVDDSADVGAQVSIAVDNSGKIGIGYFDVTNTAIKYAGYDAGRWSSVMIDTNKHTGTYPSLDFDINGDAYLAFYRRSGGSLRLAHLDRDSSVWSTQIVDDSADVGASASLDVGEAIVRSGPFTQYDTTVAIAYADSTNGDLKYSRIDVDDPTATWYTSIVDNLTGVTSIDLRLHDGLLNLGLQAQIAYLDNTDVLVKYAYRNTDWYTETVAGGGKIRGGVALYFDENDSPIVAYFQGTKRAVYVASRASATAWNVGRVATGSGSVILAANDRTDESWLSWLDRGRANMQTISLL